MRAGIETIIIPFKNKKDLDEIPEEYRRRIHFIPVKNFDEVLVQAIVGWKERLKESNRKVRRKSGPTSIAA